LTIKFSTCYAVFSYFKTGITYTLNDQKYWLGFHLVQHIGSVRLQSLNVYFGSLKQAWHASEGELRRAGLSNRPLQAVMKARHTLDLDAEMAKIKRLGAHLITLADADYPAALTSLHDAPPVLYVRGSLLPTDARALAVVGTRRATRYGQDATQRIARQLASQNITIISGLAQGIDAAAHRGALEADGRTIAVLGSGIDTVYPSEHRDLADRIVQNGALISEFPIGVPPTGSNFPRRNRIISGLALGVLIGEAPLKSGALITAETALEQGRDVFAIPANIFNQMGTGSNRLIQEGAKLVMQARDVLDELNLVYEQQTTRVHTERIAPESDLEMLILEHMETDPIHIDDLIRLSGQSTEDVTAVLTILELKGLAQMVGQMQYCRTR
jgi:DNA processing protein